ncbi:MAG TPA: hypothetical protein VNF99_21815 [Stellaceae bacterium]|nr:hypothetical protein [Stellaceae bacterium]
MAQAGARAKVPVAEVALDAYRTVFGRLSLVLDLAWLPLLLLLAVTILPGYLRLYRDLPGLPPWSGDAFGLGFETILEALVGLLCLTAFAVRWYQALLFVGGRRVPPGIFLGAWLRFLLYMLLLYLAASALLTAVLLADLERAPAYLAPLAGIAVLALWLAPVRCALVFPAAACGEPLALAAAWRAMGGNTWRLLAAALLASVPIAFVAVTMLGGIAAALHLDSAGDTPPPLGFFLLGGVIGSCANFLVVALGTSVLAAFYRRIALTPGSDRP